MITIKIMTLFPEFYESFLKSSIIGRSISRGLVKIELVNIRDYSLSNSHRVDDHPLSGGAGLIMRMEPLTSCLRDNTTCKTHKILLSPKGKTFKQVDAIRLSKEEEICLICGHYEGFDARFESYVDETISIGDFILTGGEIPAMAITDSIVRLLKGAISDESTDDESFNSSLLEHRQYTYPDEFEGLKVPEILYCGNHRVIEKYQRRDSIDETIKYRPDLLKEAILSQDDLKYIKEYKEGINSDIDEYKRAIENSKK